MIYLLQITTRFQDGDETYWKSFVSEESALEYASQLVNNVREQMNFCLLAVDTTHQIPLEVAQSKVEVTHEIITKTVRRKVET